MLGIGFVKTLIIDTLFFNRISASFLKSYFFNQKGATIFVYHLVCDSKYQEFLKSENLSQMDADLFRNHLIWLLDNGFCFVTVDELADRLISTQDVSSKSIAITFDDGFKISVDNVLPVLESLKIKATFFITTDWIDSDVLLWQQKYYWYTKHYGLKDFFDNSREIDKETFSDLNISQCHNKFMYEIKPDQKERLLKLYNRDIPDEKKLASEIYPSSRDIVKLSASGMEVGSHSCGHHYMKNLPDDLYLKEMLDSKVKLENLINKPVESFSYPFNSYRNDDGIIKKAGYKTMCTVDEQRVNSSSSLARLPRFNAPTRKLLFKNSLRKILYFYN